MGIPVPPEFSRCGFCDHCAEAGQFVLQSGNAVSLLDPEGLQSREMKGDSQSDAEGGHGLSHIGVFMESEGKPCRPAFLLAADQQPVTRLPGFHTKCLKPAGNGLVTLHP